METVLGFGVLFNESINLQSEDRRLQVSDCVSVVFIRELREDYHPEEYAAVGTDGAVQSFVSAVT